MKFRFDFTDIEGMADSIYFDSLVGLSYYLTKIDPDLLINATITKLTGE